MATPIRLVALISGGGTTLQNLIDRIAAGRLNAVIAAWCRAGRMRSASSGARNAGLPVTVIASAVRLDFADEVWAAVRAFEPDLVCFAGWLHLLPIPDDFRLQGVEHPPRAPARVWRQGNVRPARP